MITTSNPTHKKCSQALPYRRWRRGLVVFAVIASLGQLNELDAQPGHPDAIVVDSVGAMQAALAGADSGTRIIVRKGTYPVTAPLLIPDGVALEGEGIMLGGGLPTGFEPGTETRIVAAGPMADNLVTLGNGAQLKGLVIENAAGSLGNVIWVASRTPGDTLAASMVECLVINPNSHGIGPQGPTGRAIVVLTRNPNLGADPPPHEGADITLQMHRSIVRSAANFSALFAINFAPRAQINLSLADNILGGGMDVTAGVSRPDEVTGSVIAVRSERNVYVAEEAPFPGTGINVFGGSGAPIPGLATPGASSNSAYLHSKDDLIYGFQVGLNIRGGRRLSTLQGPNSGNSVDLQLLGLQVFTREMPGAADFVLRAAHSEASMPEFSAGDHNRIRVLITGATGSGARQNVYAASSGPLLPENYGVGNRLEFIGTRVAFDHTNEAIEPAPPEQYFLGNN